METELTTTDERVTVKVSGDLDLLNADHFGLVLGEALSHAPETVVDLSGVGFMDSTALGALVRIYQLANSEHRKLYVRDAQPRVARILQVTGLADLLAVPRTDG